MPILLLLITLVFSHTVAPVPGANTITIRSNGGSPSGACPVTVWVGFVGEGKSYPLKGEKFNIIRVSPAGAPIPGITGEDGTQNLTIPAGTTVRATMGTKIVSRDFICPKLMVIGSGREKVGRPKEQ